MAVQIGNAVCDENGKAKGGQPGNQTGELRIQNWYLNKKGWRVFRAKAPEVAEKLAWDCEAACKNMAIGYNQSKRNTLYTAAKPHGFNCAEVTTLCECDCSSLVRVCLAYAGIKVTDFNTASEAARIMATGQFDELTDAKYTDESAYLKRGDILVTKTKGHTAIVLSDGPKADKEPDPDPQPDPPEPGPQPEPSKRIVVVIGKSVRVRKKPSALSRTLWIAHSAAYYKAQGSTRPNDLYYLMDIAENGWYHIKTINTEHDLTGYITNKPKLTKLVDVNE